MDPIYVICGLTELAFFCRSANYTVALSWSTGWRFAAFALTLKATRISRAYQRLRRRINASSAMPTPLPIGTQGPKGTDTLVLAPGTTATAVWRCSKVSIFELPFGTISVVPGSVQLLNGRPAGQL